MFQENEIHSFERKKRKFRDNPIDQNIPKLPTGCCIDRKDLFAIRHPHPSPRNDFAWVSYRNVASGQANLDGARDTETRREEEEEDWKRRRGGWITRTNEESRDDNYRGPWTEGELSLSLCVRCNGRPTRMPTRPGRGNAARRRTGKGVRSRRCAEGVCRANTRGGRQLGLFRHGGARAVVCPAKQDIITGGVHSRRDTSSDLLPDGFLVSLLETNKREACYEASRSS